MLIRHAPEGGVVYEVFCRAFGCTAESGPLDEHVAGRDWALAHARRTGHGLFRRVFTDHARVAPAVDAVSQHPGPAGPGPGGRQ
jgi:hypothetical protein